MLKFKQDQVTKEPQFSQRGHYGLKLAPFPIILEDGNSPYHCEKRSDGKFIKPYRDLERGIYRISFPLDKIELGNYCVEARHHIFAQVYRNEFDGRLKTLAFEVDGDGHDGVGGSNVMIDGNSFSINVYAPGVVISPILTESDVKERGGVWTDPYSSALEAKIHALFDELLPIPYSLLTSNCKTAATRATNDALSLLTFNNDPKMKEEMNKLAQERLNYPINKNAPIPKVIYEVFATPSNHTLGEKITYTGRFLNGFFGLGIAEKILGPAGKILDKLLRIKPSQLPISGSGERKIKRGYIYMGRGAITCSEHVLDNGLKNPNIDNEVRFLLTMSNHSRNVQKESMV